MQSLNEIAEKRYGTVVGYCLKKTGGDEELAKECAAEVFLRAEKLGDPPKHPNIEGWLLRTARNVVREKQRERKKYYGRNVSLEALMEKGRDIEAPFFAREYEFLGSLWEDEADDEEIERLKERILSLLPPADRELMDMAYEKKLSLSEMADKLGRSKDAVRVRLARLSNKVTQMVRNYFDRE